MAWLGVVADIVYAAFSVSVVFCVYVMSRRIDSLREVVSMLAQGEIRRSVQASDVVLQEAIARIEKATRKNRDDKE